MLARRSRRLLVAWAPVMQAAPVVTVRNSRIATPCTGNLTLGMPNDHPGGGRSVERVSHGVRCCRTNQDSQRDCPRGVLTGRRVRTLGAGSRAAFGRPEAPHTRLTHLLRDSFVGRVWVRALPPLIEPYKSPGPSP